MKKRIAIFTLLAFIAGAALATIVTTIYLQQSQPRSDFIFHGATNWSMIGYVKENSTANKPLHSTMRTMPVRCALTNEPAQRI